MDQFKRASRPSWMMMELISFGTLDRIFRSLHRQYTKPIAQSLNTSPEVLSTWLRTLSNLRNLCAHHHRIWNRMYQFRPTIPLKFNSVSSHLDHDKFFIRAQIMNFILQMGRKNWLFCDSVAGARAAEVIYSIIETAKYHHLEPYSYLRGILTSLPNATSESDVEALLPFKIDQSLLTIK